MTFKSVLLVKPSGRKGLGFASDVIPIGLEYIASSIEDVVDDVTIIDLELEQGSIRDFLEDSHPDLVAVSMSACDHYEGLEIAKIAKMKGCTTVFGGYHPTAIPENLLMYPYVDLIVRGEGEYIMRELVQKESLTDILGLSYKIGGKIIHNKDRPPISDLDSLPFPARHLRRHEYKNHIMSEKGRKREVITMSRGCWGRCSFCCEPMMSRGYQRFRSPENVMDELVKIVSFHKGAPLNIFVTDPNFLGFPQLIDRLCNLLHQHQLDIKFSVLVRADSVVKHPDLIGKMCKNGIISYEMGIESPKAEDLVNVQKNISSEMQEKAVKILRDNGAWVGGTFVIGLPGQSEEEIKTFPVYAKKIGLHGAAFGVATPFPETKFYRELEREGLIADRDWTKYDEMHSVFELKNMSMERLEELATYCHAKFWTLDAFIQQICLSLEPENKIPLKEFIENLIKVLRFGWQTGIDVQKENTFIHRNIAIEAGADTCVEEYTKTVGIHNIIKFPAFSLDILGDQKIQFTIIYEGLPITSYILKTAAGTVEYVSAIPGREEDATINLDIDLDNVDLSGNNNSNWEFLKNCIRITITPHGIDEIWSRTRLLAAIGVGSTQVYLLQNIRSLEKAGSSAAAIGGLK